MPNILFDPTLRGLAETLTLTQRRHEVLASNLANVETPGFRARDLDFGSALRDAFAVHRQGELGEDEPPDAPHVSVVEDRSAPARADGNTVDLDLQMAKLTANGTRYLALARLLGMRIGLLRQAIQGGGS
jgi:flagellar basal-body rod protein FlgB